MNRIKVSGKSFDVEIAKTENEKRRGLSNRESLDKNKGMLFIYEEEQDELSFTMKNTKIPLDIIFFDEDGDVLSVQKGTPLSDEEYIEYNVKYVLEVNADSGIKEGMYLEMEDIEDNVEDDSDKDNSNKDNSDDKFPKMQVLDSEGNTQYELDGGERIVSRRETKVLIKKAKKANSSKSSGAYKSLARYAFKVIMNQDSRDPEFIQKKN